MKYDHDFSEHVIAYDLDLLEQAEKEFRLHHNPDVLTVRPGSYGEIFHDGFEDDLGDDRFSWIH